MTTSKQPQGADNAAIARANPIVVALFGTNCVGKSTLSRVLATRLPRCAVIEVDGLRGNIAGVLRPVREEHLSSAQEEYASQWAVAESNALLLADNFARHGYSSVIDGLPQRYSGLLPDRFAHSCRSSLLRVGLYCSHSTLIERRRQRGWIRRPTKADCRSLKWCQAVGAFLDCSIDTGALNADSAAEVILASIATRCYERSGPPSRFSEQPLSTKRTQAPRARGSMLGRAKTIEMLLTRLVPLGHHDGDVAVARQRRDLGLGWLYYSLVRVLKPTRVVVVGSFRGFSVVCMALALEDNDNGSIDFIDASTVDQFWLDRKAVREHFGVFGVADRITVHRMTTANFLRDASRHSPPINFLFLDGDHQRSAVRFDHTGFGPILAPDAYVAFHDSFVGGFGFTEWEVADYLSTIDLSQYEVLTFPVGQGLTLLKRLSSSLTRRRQLRNQQRLLGLVRRHLSTASPKEQAMARLAMRIAEDTTASQRSAYVRLRFLLKANADLRRELRGAKNRPSHHNPPDNLPCV